MAFERTILEAERVVLILYIVIIILGAAIISFSALSANDQLTAFRASVSVVSGIAVLSIIIYLETHVWNSE